MQRVRDMKQGLRETVCGEVELRRGRVSTRASERQKYGRETGEKRQK